MNKLKVKYLLNLIPAGTDLFKDAESFIVELSEESKQELVSGGGGVNVWNKNTYCP